MWSALRSNNFATLSFEITLKSNKGNFSTKPRVYEIILLIIFMSQEGLLRGWLPIVSIATSNRTN